eukprot:TRINITY_DN13435_c0_g1_i1.p1 TRINITY_DN13435_c0_g1~~TRINITY_DN13435_c0_g1_i1.p1  ORF type:complete len:486 (+),score=157.45 TRINITY_DN13435_c0_g1_i1:48-1505(+)
MGDALRICKELAQGGLSRGGASAAPRGGRAGGSAVLNILDRVPRLQRVPLRDMYKRRESRPRVATYGRDAMQADLDAERSIRKLWKPLKPLLKQHDGGDVEQPAVRRAVASACLLFDETAGRGAAGANALNALLELLLLAGQKGLFRKQVMAFKAGERVLSRHQEDERRRRAAEKRAPASLAPRRGVATPLFSSYQELCERTLAWNHDTFELGLRYCAAARDLPAAQHLVTMAPRPTRAVLQAFLVVLAKTGAPVHAGVAWVEEHAPLRDDVAVYNTLLPMCQHRADCRAVLDAMRARGLAPDALTFTLLFRLAKRTRDVAFAADVARTLHNHPRLAFAPEHVSALLACHAAVGDYCSIQALLATVAVPLTAKDYASVIRACARSGPAGAVDSEHYTIADALYRQARVAGLFSRDVLDAVVYLRKRADDVGALQADLADAAASGIALPTAARQDLERWHAAAGRPAPPPHTPVTTLETPLAPPRP